MLSAAHAVELLRRATFRVSIERNRDGTWDWGTGFFIGEDGAALTAFHNLPAAVVAAGGGTVRALYCGRWIRLECRVDRSLPEAAGDIAVLRLVDPAPHDFLTVQHPPLDWTRAVRARYWAGRPMCALGYPFEGERSTERFVCGALDATMPLLESARAGAEGQMDAVVEWMRFMDPERAVALEGISGAPVLDLESGFVVGVQHRYVPKLAVVYATELRWLAKRWAGFSSYATICASVDVPSSRETAQERPPRRGSLPPYPTLCVGREAALNDLRDRVSREASLTVMRGWPGVGKTTLTAALAHDPEIHATFPDGVLWASLGQDFHARPVLRRWLEAVSNRQPPDHLADDDLRSALATELRQSRCLLVIDDMWAPAHAAALAVGGRFCATLVTTREPGAARELARRSECLFWLPVLESERAMQLLFLICPTVVARYSPQCFQLVEELQGLPLSILVAGRLLAAEADCGFGVEELLEQLRDGTRLLPELAPIDRTGLGDDAPPSIDALLKLSTDRLAEEDRIRFAMLGTFAPKPANFDLAAIGAVWDIDNPKPAVRTLVDRGLLEPLPASGRYQIHSLLVAHARALCESGI